MGELISILKRFRYVVRQKQKKRRKEKEKAVTEEALRGKEEGKNSPRLAGPTRG